MSFMSGIQDIAQRVQMLSKEANDCASYIRNLTNWIIRTSNTTMQLIHGTAQSNYQVFLNHMSTAQAKLIAAAENLDFAENYANDWLARHVVAPSIEAPVLMEGMSINIVDEISSNRHNTEPEFSALSDYMDYRNYPKEPFPPSYCNDPVWRVLHKAAFPESVLPPIERTAALSLLRQYMGEHNYKKEDQGTYSADPVWQELNKYAFPAKRALGARPEKDKASSEYCSVIDALESIGVEHRPVELYGTYRSTEEIVSRLGGGDRTKGSCSSLAFAYIGNRAGFDVLDFRDGASRNFFSANNNIEMIASLPGVEAQIERGTDDVECSNTLLSTVQEGQEYYFATGQHAAIVRRNNGAIEYLELQSFFRNGWKKINDSVLINRFGCDREQQNTYPNFLISVDSMLCNNEFMDILGYLNTAESAQRKGWFGHVR